MFLFTTRGWLGKYNIWRSSWFPIFYSSKFHQNVSWYKTGLLVGLAKKGHREFCVPSCLNCQKVRVGHRKSNFWLKYACSDLKWEDTNMDFVVGWNAGNITQYVLLCIDWPNPRTFFPLSLLIRQKSILDCISMRLSGFMVSLSPLYWIEVLHSLHTFEGLLKMGWVLKRSLEPIFIPRYMVKQSPPFSVYITSYLIKKYIGLSFTQHNQYIRIS